MKALVLTPSEQQQVNEAEANQTTFAVLPSTKFELIVTLN